MGNQRRQCEDNFGNTYVIERRLKNSLKFLKLSTMCFKFQVSFVKFFNVNGDILIKENDLVCLTNFKFVKNSDVAQLKLHF